MALIKVVMYKVGDPEKPRILLLAPNRVAAININRTSIHSGLRINVGSKLHPLRDRQNEALGKKLSEVKLIIIDEISMLSNAPFFQVNRRLNEIFGYLDAGPPVIVCGHFYQLPQVKGLQIYSSTTSIKGFLPLDFWKKLQMVGLTEVM